MREDYELIKDKREDDRQEELERIKHKAEKGEVIKVIGKW